VTVRLALRIARAVHVLAVALLALHTASVLITGGYQAWPLGFEMSGTRIAPPVMSLLALLMVGLPLYGREPLRRAYAAHAPLVLFSGLMLVYLANGHTLEAGDSLPARYLPFSILRRGDFYLDDIESLSTTPRPHFVQRVRGHLVSDYPVGAALLALPLYVPSVLGGVTPESPLATQLEKLSAATIVAMSAVFLYLALRRLTDARMSFVLAVIYGLGTSTLSVSSQAQWQHGAGQLALAAALLALVRARSDPTWFARAGLPLAFAVLCRPPDALLVAPLAAYALLRRPCPWRFFAWALPPVAFQLWYNATYFGDPLHSQFPLLGSGLWSMRLSDGLIGLLFSPGRGLFAYSPVLLLSAVGMGLVWRREGDALLRALSLGVVASVLLYARWIVWWGGLANHPPRILVDLTPALILLLVPLVPYLRRSLVARGLFLSLALWSVVAHLVAALTLRERESASLDLLFERLWDWNAHPIVGTLARATSASTGWMRVATTGEIPPHGTGFERFFADRVRSTAGGAAPAGLQPGALANVQLAVNGDVFRTGSRLRLGLHVRTAPGSPVYDLYAGLLFPDGKTVAFFAHPGILTTPVPVAKPQWFVRLRPVAGGSTSEEDRFFDLFVHSHLAFGTFYAFALLVDRPPPIDGIGRPWTIVAGDIKSLHLVRD
jgi:hypothetical protein